MGKFKNIVLLAGGKSDRFWPLEDKSTFSFLDTSLVLLQVKRLLPSVSERLYVVVNSSNSKAISELVSGADDRAEIIVQEGQGQAAAILSCNAPTGDTLIVNNNDFFDKEPINDLLIKKEELNPDAMLVAFKANIYFPGGYLKVDADNVREVIEKPSPKELPSNYVRVVLDYFKKIEDFIEVLKNTQSETDDAYEKAITDFIKKGKSVKFVEYNNQWFALKYPWHLLSLTKHFLSLIKGKDRIHIGKNVKIGQYVKIGGPCYIGDNSIIGDHALIRESHIGANCVIGGGTEVARSYIANNVQLHRNYIGDSVIAENVLFGAGAVTANYRFDGKEVKSFIKGEKKITELVKLGAVIGRNARIGVNVTLLPGVKVGKNSIVGPGETLKEDLENDTFIFNGKKKQSAL